MEYRYDAAWQRYMVRPREPITMMPYASDDGTWHDYSADSIYADYTLAYDNSSESVVVTETMAHEPGLAQFDRLAAGGTGEMSYLHGNLVGTTEAMSGDAGAMEYGAVYTAFGEAVFTDGSVGTRYGYAGAWGYQAPSTADPLAELGWLHVGHRYYAPELGRFVQRDPIGVQGGFNVYEYAKGRPTTTLDPDGLMPPGGGCLRCGRMYCHCYHPDLPPVPLGPTPFDKGFVDGVIPFVNPFGPGPDGGGPGYAAGSALGDLVSICIPYGALLKYGDKLFNKGPRIIGSLSGWWGRMKPVIKGKLKPITDRWGPLVEPWWEDWKRTFR